MSTAVVEWLQAKLTQVEETARAATAGPWWAEDMSPRRWGEERDAEIASSKGLLAVLPYDKNGALNAEHVVLHDPTAVLRRVAADRQILDEHQELGIEGNCARCVDWDEDDEGDLCAYPLPWPCRTVLLLAQAWGWTAP